MHWVLFSILCYAFLYSITILMLFSSVLYSTSYFTLSLSLVHSGAFLRGAHGADHFFVVQHFEMHMTRHRVHFYPLAIIVAIHFSPSCQPASQVLLPWRRLICWHMNPLLLSALLTSSPLRSVTVHSLCSLVRESSSPRALTRSSHPEPTNVNYQLSNTWLVGSLWVVTSGYDPEVGFISCSLSRVLSLIEKNTVWKEPQREREKQFYKCQDHLSVLFWSAGLAFGLNTCRAKGQTCRHRKQIWWTLQQRWHSLYLWDL